MSRQLVMEEACQKWSGLAKAARVFGPERHEQGTLAWTSEATLVVVLAPGPGDWRRTRSISDGEAEEEAVSVDPCSSGGEKPSNTNLRPPLGHYE